MRFRAFLALAVLGAPVVLAAQEPTPRRFSVVGSVRDSIADKALVGAVVQIVLTDAMRTAWSTRTDDRGRFRFDSIAPGEYFATFYHPAVDSLGVQAPVRRVRLGARDPERLDLGIPALKQVMTALCPDMQPSDSAAVLVGEVRDADTGAPMAGATVVAYWVDFIIDREGLRTVPQGVQTSTGAGGAFALCQLPSNGQVAVQATAGARATGVLEVDFTTRSVVRRDFTLGEGTTVVLSPGDGSSTASRDTVLRGPARLTGTVFNESNRPVRDAIVEVLRTGTSTATDTAGRFELANLPVGTHALEVRRIGFAPQHIPVQLASRGPSIVNVVLEKPVRMLDAVQVTETIYSRRQVELERRRRRGFGHFITREELDRSAASQLSDILRRVPGVRVYSSPTGNVVVFQRGSSFSGPCRPTVYLDGMRLGTAEDLDFLANVNTLEAVEVYTSAGQAPVEFWSGGCGSLVLWTRMEGGRPVPKAKPDSGQ
jgi:hypothetical protein